MLRCHGGGAGTDPALVNPNASIAIETSAFQSQSYQPISLSQRDVIFQMPANGFQARTYASPVTHRSSGAVDEGLQARGFADVFDYCYVMIYMYTIHQAGDERPDVASPISSGWEGTGGRDRTSTCSRDGTQPLASKYFI